MKAGRSDSQARVSSRQYGALWRLVALALDDELFGQDSRRMKSGTFAMMCYSSIVCGSLHHALVRSVRLIGLVLDDTSCSLNIGKYETGLQLSEHGDISHVFGQECLLMLIHGLACWLVGQRIPILRAQFNYAEPPHSIEYRSMYTSDLTFESPHTTIFFDSKYLALTVVQNIRTLKEFLRTAPDGILVKYKNATGLTARVRHRLRKSFGGELLKLDAMACSLGVTPASFRRQLHREGTSYRMIKEQLRRELAISHVVNRKLTTTEIGWDLGYSERSAFDRAFKKWTGIAPGQFRRGVT